MNLEIQVLSVTQLNRQVRCLLEDMASVAVAGEISNLSKPASGHFYFSLKDANAQIRCVYFRNRHHPAQPTLENGQQVQALGTLSLYEARGDYQLIVERLDDAGLGDLHRKFELLKQKLAAMGLFDPARKKAIPTFPQCIGVISSKTGAALQDILSTLKRRYPLARVIIYPSEVQGKLAPIQLIAALQKANQELRTDVLILARGGGSLEDLWAFNDENLAYAIANSTIPVVSGVGHETDFTITDFVADLRAATPTAAAEAVCPNQFDLKALIQKLEAQLIMNMNRSLQHKRMLLNHQLQIISSPRQLILSYWQKLDYYQSHLDKAMQTLLLQKQQLSQILMTRLSLQNQQHLLNQAKLRAEHAKQAIIQLIGIKLRAAEERYKQLISTLNAVSPLSTLERGYAIVSHKERPIYNAADVQVGDSLDIRLAKGRLRSKVISKDD